MTYIPGCPVPAPVGESPCAVEQVPYCRGALQTGIGNLRERLRKNTPPGGQRVRRTRGSLPKARQVRLKPQLLTYK